MLEENTLTYDEYIDIITTIGWKCPSKRLLELSLKNSMTVKYKEGDEVVGMARLVTDNGYIALVADVIVKPEFQGKGIGRMMIENLLSRAKESLEDGEVMMVQLLAADGKMEFYKKFGFKDKKEVVEAGMYMWLNKN